MNQFATRTSQSRFTIPALLLLLSLAAVAAHAQTQITRCGTTITAPGEYVLANDLTNCNIGIVISNVNNVVVRLAGHRITGRGMQNTSAGIWLQSATDGIRIEGPGVISNFMGSRNSGGILLFSVGQHLEVTGVTCSGNTWGIAYANGNARVHGNIAINNGDGLVAFTGSYAVEFSDNLVSGNRQDGIAFTSSRGGLTVIHNTVAFNGRYGISADPGSRGNTINSNTALGNGAYDVIEQNDTCQNTWEDNTYGTAKGPCFQ